MRIKILELIAIKSIVTSALLLVSHVGFCEGFSILHTNSGRLSKFANIEINRRYTKHTLFANKPNGNTGKGFGKASSSNGKGFANKTYGSAIRPSTDDIIDVEAAMSNFFTSYKEWDPLFSSIVSSPNVPAMNYLEGNYEDELTFSEVTPWKQLEGVPTDKEVLSVIAEFLDNMQKSLVEIPVDEAAKNDSSDLHFLEEGRRMLVITRFHVLKTEGLDRLHLQDKMFMTCWSELGELNRANQIDTGSVILLPGYDYQDLKRFVTINIQLPLKWMGVTDSTFEVATINNGTPGIRIIYKLSDIPDLPNQRDPLTMS